MSDPIIVALIAAVPATLTGAAAWRNARATNKAVNNRPANEPSISDDVKAVRTKVESIEYQLSTHLAWHERQHLGGP